MYHYVTDISFNVVWLSLYLVVTYITQSEYINFSVRFWLSRYFCFRFSSFTINNNWCIWRMSELWDTDDTCSFVTSINNTWNFINSPKSQMLSKMNKTIFLTPVDDHNVFKIILSLRNTRELVMRIFVQNYLKMLPI